MPTRDAKRARRDEAETSAAAAATEPKTPISGYNEPVETPSTPKWAFEFVEHEQFSRVTEVLGNVINSKLLPESSADGTKEDFVLPVINGGWGSGKSRTAWEVCVATRAEFAKLGKNIEYRVYYMHHGLRNREQDHSLAEALLQVTSRDERRLDYDLRGVLEWIKRKQPSIDAIVLNIDEYQYDSEASALIARACARLHQSSSTVLPVYPILSGTGSAALAAQLHNTFVRRVEVVVLAGLATQAHLNNLQSKFEATLRTAVSLSARRNLGFLVRDLGGFPMLYKYLRDVLLRDAEVKLSEGLGVDTSKRIHAQLSGNCQAGLWSDSMDGLAVPPRRRFRSQGPACETAFRGHHHW